MPLGALMLAGLAGGAIQHRPLWSGEPLRPQLSRLSPLSGMKRVFGCESVAQFLKGLLKIVIVGSVTGAVLWSERDRLDAFARLDPGALLVATLSLAMKLLGGVLAIYAFLAIGDALSARLLAQPAAHDAARAEGGIQGDRRQPRDQGAPAPDSPDAAQEAHDGRENPPLARALHASVDLDEEMPVEHYKAVAEVIGYVLR